MLSTHHELQNQIDEIERKFDVHDHKIRVILDAIKKLMEPSPDKEKRKIGFKA